MPPIVPLFLCFLFIAYLFWRDDRRGQEISWAIALPLCWLLIISSRAVTQWLAFAGINIGGTSIEEGSAVDATIYFTMTMLGIRELSRRGVRLATILSQNRWFALYFAYCLLAIVWSDFPFVSFKRWIKGLGHPVMALLVLTELNPVNALVLLLKRATYVVVPLSIVLIKYFPHIGRTFSEWNGLAQNTGVAGNKNSLGYDLMILTMFLAWNWIRARQMPPGRERRREIWLSVFFLAMIAYLFKLAPSSTGIICASLGITIMLLLGYPSIQRKATGPVVLALLIMVILAHVMFDIFVPLFHALGKDATLTGRTDLWGYVWELRGNPVVGIGFESFWLGYRSQALADIYWWKPTQAHNGYLETFLNLGGIGLFLLLGLLMVTFRKGRRQLWSDPLTARWRLALLLTFIVYNWTEAGFKGLHLVWFMFFLIALDYPRREVEVPDEQTEAETAGSQRSLSWAPA